MTRFHFVRIDPESNTRRFYAARVQATLFGTFALVREWGRIGSPGRVESEEYVSQEEAEAALNRLRQTKEKRGYECMIGDDAADEHATGAGRSTRATSL
jgi:predicted DNA-binding WGR domain protein